MVTLVHCRQIKHNIHHKLIFNQSHCFTKAAYALSTYPNESKWFDIWYDSYLSASEASQICDLSAPAYNESKEGIWLEYGQTIL